MAQRGAPPAEALMWDQAERNSPWDDRGLILIRHGEPDEVIRVASGDGTLPKEAWIYYAMNGVPAVFEFRKAPLWADYVAALPVECDVSQARRDVRPDARGLATFQRVILDYGTRLAAADPDATSRAYRCYNALARGKLSEELPYIRLSEASRALEARNAMMTALQTETAGHRFANPLRILASVYALKGADSSTTISTFLKLPAEALTPAPMYQGVRYPLQVSLAVEDQVARTVQRVDTLLRHDAPGPLVGGQHVRTVVHIPARPAADATVRLTVSNTYEPAEGQSLAFRRPVPTFTTGDFALSDLIVAEPGNAGYWTRGNASLSPVPGHQIAGHAFRLYYEIYGLSDNESVRTRIVLSPTHEDGLKSRLRAIFGGRSVQELEFDERTTPDADGITSVDRTITTTLDPGRYVLELTIQRSSTGERLATSTEIVLIEIQQGRKVP
jgi:hypothetical protein